MLVFIFSLLDTVESLFVLPSFYEALLIIFAIVVCTFFLFLCRRLL